MRQGREGEPTGSATSATPLQPLPAGALDDFDDSAEAQHVDRLEGDVDLHLTLALQGFQGPDYERFADVVARYGYAVIRGWLRSGLIYKRVRDLTGAGLQPAPVDALLRDDAADEVALEVVAHAVRAFREHVLLKKRWDPTKKASLKTYFVGQCLMQVPNVYRRWLAETRTWSDTRADQQLSELADRASGDPRGDPAALAVQEAILAEALASIPNPRTRVALLLTAQGYDQTEIAEQIGTTRKAVERLIAKHWERQREAKAG